MHRCTPVCTDKTVQLHFKMLVFTRYNFAIITYSDCCIRVVCLISALYNDYDVGNTRKDQQTTKESRRESKK